jgi:hypothetical protein
MMEGGFEMSVPEEHIRQHLIEPERAVRHAAVQLHTGIFTNTPGMANWWGANLGRPVSIHDLNGQPLFYDIPVFSPESEQLGLVRASASRVLGVPAPTVYLGGPRWRTGEATLWAREFVQKEHQGRVIDTQLVCYAYPKLGVAVTWEDGKRERRRTIIDVSDYSIVPEKVKPEMRGPGAWSLYERIPEEVVPEAVESFGLYERIVDELQERSDADLSVRLELERFEAVQGALGMMISLYTTKILTFCTHSYSHECFRMHGQETDYYCVVATGQMVLDFWRYCYSQDDIATAMGTDPGGTGWTEEVNGLESLTCSHFDAQSDFSPTFAKARAEIDANRPFDYSYDYHAMACAGYQRQNFYIAGVGPTHSVYLYDPWPVNVGTIRWETWGAGVSPVAGFVYLRRT